MKYKDDKSMQFLKGNAAQLFKSFMTEMDPHATPRDLEKLMQAAKPQVVGPEVKNSYTLQFEEIVKALLVNTPIPVFEEKEGKLQITLDKKIYNLDEIMMNMQRTQIALTPTHLNLYTQFIASPHSKNKPREPGPKSLEIKNLEVLNLRVQSSSEDFCKI